MKKIVLIFIISSSIIACNKQEAVKPESFHYQYFPLSVNAEYIYRTDSFIYNDFTNTIDTFSGLLKYKSISVSKDTENRNSFKIHTYYKRNDTLNWQPVNVWSAVLDQDKNRAERLTENHRYVPLVFPVRDQQKWDCNAMNSSEPRDCKYSDLHQKFDNNFMQFDSVLTVEMHNDSNFVFQDLHIEKYAKHIGLIFVNIKQIETQTDYTKGFEYEQRLIEYNFD